MFYSAPGNAPPPKKTATGHPEDSPPSDDGVTTLQPRTSCGGTLGCTDLIAAREGAPEHRRKEGSVFPQDSEEGVKEGATSGLIAVSQAALGEREIN